MNQLWFTRHDIRCRWAEVRHFFWEEIEQQRRWAQKRFLQAELPGERETQMAGVVEPTERSPSRPGQWVLHSGAHHQRGAHLPIDGAAHI